jgi:hypothetical protein
MDARLVPHPRSGYLGVNPKLHWIALLSLGMTTAVLLAATALAGLGPEVRDKAQALDVRFGVLDKAGRFVETDEVPLRLGTVYGWRAWVAGDGPVAWREEFTLPTAPKAWGAGKVSPDGRTSVTEGRAVPSRSTDLCLGRAPDGGWIGHDWSVIEGDPAGEAAIRVHLDGRLARELRVRFR